MPICLNEPLLNGIADSVSPRWRQTVNPWKPETVSAFGFFRADNRCDTSQCILPMCLFNNGQPANPEQGHPFPVLCSRPVEAAE